MSKTRIISLGSALALLVGLATLRSYQTVDASPPCPGRERDGDATLAGGCFWGIVPPFEQLTGVEEILSGYTGGQGLNPTYEDYAEKGHLEAIQVTYDPTQISYPQLLDVFWRQVNPTDAGGQFADRGPMNPKWKSLF